MSAPPASWTAEKIDRPGFSHSTNRSNTRLQEGQYEISVPVLMDRCHQARVRNALEPEWEARFEPRSYGFRPGRSCQDAIGAIYTTCKGPRAKRVWALDADLAAALDVLRHCFFR
jgi:RNA-directed DNA polymerase